MLDSDLLQAGICAPKAPVEILLTVSSALPVMELFIVFWGSLFVTIFWPVSPRNSQELVFIGFQIQRAYLM